MRGKRNLLTYIPIVNFHGILSQKGQDSVSKISQILFAAVWIVNLSPFEDKTVHGLVNLATHVIDFRDVKPVQPNCGTNYI